MSTTGERVEGLQVTVHITQISESFPHSRTSQDWLYYSPREPVILGSPSSYLREKHVNTHTHSLQSQSLYDMDPGLVFFNKLHKCI